ncbi:unnamed protein product [Camellia sinensis]
MFGGDSDICENAPGMQIFIMSNMHSVFVRGSKRFKLMFLSLNCACAAFFYYEVDGSSLCLQCDMIVHVGGKRTHERYLVLRQRIEFPGDKPGRMEDPTENRRGENQQLGLTMGENQQNHRVPKSATNADADGHANTKTNMMDLNMQPHQIHEQASNNQVRLSPLFIYQKQILNFVLI